VEVVDAAASRGVRSPGSSAEGQRLQKISKTAKDPVKL
jgi:hypothetical protein